MRFLPPRHLLPLLGLLASCGGGGGSAGPGLRGGASGVRAVEGPLDVGAQCRLAGVLVTADPFLPSLGGPDWKGLPGGVAKEWSAIGEAALSCLFLESGLGLSSLRSPWMGERAGARPWIPDTNANGTVRDEVRDRLRKAYAFRTGAGFPKDSGDGFLLPRRVEGRFLRRPRGRNDLAGLRLAPPDGRALDLRPGDLGRAIEALVKRAGTLLARGRGDLYGADADSGMRGLLLLEQALALDRLAVRELGFDGRTLGGTPDPERYDPRKSPRLSPARVAGVLVPGKDGLGPLPEGLRAADRGASLGDQARLLRGFTALASLASPSRTNNLLRRLFEGDPFGKGPESAGSPVGVVSWEKHIKGLLGSRCVGCHSPPFPSGGFSIATYRSVLAGGRSAKTHPTVVKGKRNRSLLWSILTSNPPKGFNRMPKFGPYLSKAEIDLVGDWIDGGAIEKDPGAGAADPRPGLDGVVLILRNLEAFFLDPSSGGLADRADLGGPGEEASADSIGEALAALAATREALPARGEALRLLPKVAAFVEKRFLLPDGGILDRVGLGGRTGEGARAGFRATASIVAGLHAAAGVLGDSGLRAAAERAARRWWADFVDPDGGVRPFRSSSGRRLDPEDLAEALEALASWRRTGGPAALGARAQSLVSWFFGHGGLLAEWPASGEVFGDGDPDSDRDGIPEVGTDLRPALFAPLVQDEASARGLGFPLLPPRFSRDLLPRLFPRCGACHMGGARRGGFALDRFDELFRGGDFRDRIPILVPGNPGASFLWMKLVLRNPPFGVQMPLGRPPVDPATRALLADWIRSGAPRN